jgi:hypothetical protein
MSPTIHRPPTDDEAPHRFEFLHGIDLDRLHVRSPRSRRRWSGAGIVALVLLAATAVLLTVAQEPVAVPDAALEAQIATAHDSGIAQAVRAHEAELAAARDGAHDSGIAQAVRAHEAELAAARDAAHDSGIAPAIRDRNAALNAVHDSGIDASLRDR